MSSKMVHQKHHSCASKDSESALSNNCKIETHSASNDDKNHSQTDTEGGPDITDKTYDRPSLFRCWICQKNFSSMAALKAHCLSHSAPYVCGACHMEFPQMKNLRIHGTAAHTEKRLLVCFAASASNNDKNHSQTDTKREPDITDKTCDRPSLFVCWICQKNFSSMAALKAHCLSHSAPYVCGACHMEFPTWKNLRIHGTGAHTRKRLLVCEECGKVFRKICQLRIHLAVHSVEKPYKCAFCERGFTHMHSLKKHCEQHTSLLPVDARGRRGGFSKNAQKPCFWDNLRKGFSKNYLKDRRQAVEKS